MFEIEDLGVSLLLWAVGILAVRVVTVAWRNAAWAAWTTYVVGYVVSRLTEAPAVGAGAFIVAILFVVALRPRRLAAASTTRRFHR